MTMRSAIDRSPPVLRAGALGLLLVAAGLAGCAGPGGRPVAAAPGVAAPIGPTGVIVSSREVILQIAGAEGGVLGALGAPASTGEDLAPAMEFIVRESDGKIISVMQPEPTRFRPGDRVRIIQGVTTRLAPLT